MISICVKYQCFTHSGFIAYIKQIVFIVQNYSKTSIEKSLLWTKKKVVLQDRWPLQRGFIHMKCYMSG